MQGPSELGASGKLANWDRTADLGKIDVPTLVIGAQHDTMDPAHMEKMAAQVQHGRYLFCPERQPHGDVRRSEGVLRRAREVHQGRGRRPVLSRTRSVDVGAVPLTSLWLPILLSAVAVFIASSVIHMVLTYHRTDYRKLPSEDQVMDALRRFSIPPGDYMMPCAGSPSAMKDPAFVDKLKKGPIAIMTIMPSGQWSMGPQLAAVVRLFRRRQPLCGLPHQPRGAGRARRTSKSRASRARSRSSATRSAQWPQAIWYRKSVSTTIKSTIDGLIYGFLTGGFFGWLWPSA